MDRCGLSQSQDDTATPILDYFKRPKSGDLDMFFSFHPRQKCEKSVMQVCFCKDGTNRKRLSYSEENHALFCFICMAFAKPTENSPFMNGMADWKHVHQGVGEHEKSVMHRG